MINMDRIPMKVIIGGLIFVIGLALIFNYALHHDDHTSDSTRLFDVNKVEELMKPHITVAHREQLQDKMKVLRSGSRNHLQVIMDFDRTLSKYKDENDKTVKSTHDIFSLVETVPQSYKDGAVRLYSMYGPIEQDPSISVQDKLPFMQEWIYEYDLLIQGIAMNKSLIEHAVKKANLVIRDGVVKMFKDLREASVPVLIFSAGLGDVIKAALHVHGMNMPNVHVISNFFKYSDGKITGFKGRYIHAFNKDQRILEEIDFKYAKDLTGRNNVILVGDSLGDASMADGLSHSATILKIGFLNNQINENLPYYKEKFDIVTANDETMNVTNTLLKYILYQSV